MAAGGAARTVALEAIRGAAMPGNDQLTALDAAFLELEQADDGALMHIGAALVFDPLPDCDRRTRIVLSTFQPGRVGTRHLRG